MSGGRQQTGHHPQAGYAMPPPPYGWQQHHPEAVFVNAPRESTSITRLTMPAVMAVLVIVFAAGASYAVAIQFSELRHAVDRIDAKIDNFRTDLSARIDRLEAATWTKTDQALWCSRAEQANSGWRCDDTRPFRPEMPKIDGWKPRG